MADFQVAYAWMMDNEDSAREYAQVPDAPPGAYAISGINSHAFPDQFAVVAAIPQGYRGVYIRRFYQANFWNQWFGQLTSDELAKRVFDAAVNMGPGTAVTLLQKAVNSLNRGTASEDGVWGPLTILGCDACDLNALAVAFIAARCQHYRDIVVTNPADEKYLANWIVRASK